MKTVKILCDTQHSRPHIRIRKYRFEGAAGNCVKSSATVGECCIQNCNWARHREGLVAIVGRKTVVIESESAERGPKRSCS